MESKTAEVVFITGASSGIGAALAIEYAKQGARLCLFARRGDRLEQIASKCRQHYLDRSASTAAENDRVLICEGDVRQRSDLNKAVAKTRNCFGRIDTVIANAGFSIGGRFEQLSSDDYRQVFETNVFGVIETVYSTFEELKLNRGRIAILGSVNSYVSLPKSSPYCMSKFAVRALADSLYYEFLKYGISVTLICPGLVESEIRRLDTSGRFDPFQIDRVPKWLTMPSDRAARKIVRAVKKRKRELILTIHGRMGIFFIRHWPGFMAPFLKLANGIRWRSEKESL